jgi:hypothetical protein
VCEFQWRWGKPDKNQLMTCIFEKTIYHVTVTLVIDWGHQPTTQRWKSLCSFEFSPTCSLTLPYKSGKALTVQKLTVISLFNDSDDNLLIKSVTDLLRIQAQHNGLFLGRIPKLEYNLARYLIWRSKALCFIYSQFACIWDIFPHV